MYTNLIQKHFQNLETSAHRPFVAPILCKDLLELGLTKTSLHSWKIHSGDAFVFTEHYDPDGYYAAAQSLLDQNYCTAVLPAYQATDLIPLIGNFNHIYFNNEHEIKPLTYPHIGIKKAPRFPDVVAMVLIDLLKRQTVSAIRINQLLKN